MERPEPRRRLIVNADDFGRSPAINAAVIEAHQRGILTSASLMVNEERFDEAVCLAREHPGLGVGLHLTLVCGRAALPAARYRGLTVAGGRFSSNPTGAGLRYFFSRSLRRPLRDEIEAQFERFHATGLPLDHVNGHLNMHLHPVVFDILMENAGRWGVRRMRLTGDSFLLNARIASGAWGYRASHAFIYRILSARSRPRLRRRTIRFTGRVFGLLQNGRVSEEFVLKLLPRLPPGDSELYSHPSLDVFRHEFEALVSARVAGLIKRLGIQLIRYQDL